MTSDSGALAHPFADQPTAPTFLARVREIAVTMMRSASGDPPRPLMLPTGALDDHETWLGLWLAGGQEPADLTEDAGGVTMLRTPSADATDTGDPQLGSSVLLGLDYPDPRWYAALPQLRRRRLLAMVWTTDLAGMPASVTEQPKTPGCVTDVLADSDGGRCWRRLTVSDLYYSRTYMRARRYRTWFTSHTCDVRIEQAEPPRQVPEPDF